MYCPNSESKGADQLRVFVYAFAKRWFSNDTAHIQRRQFPALRASLKFWGKNPDAVSSKDRPNKASTSYTTAINSNDNINEKKKKKKKKKKNEKENVKQ